MVHALDRDSYLEWIRVGTTEATTLQQALSLESRETNCSSNKYMTTYNTLYNMKSILFAKHFHMMCCIPYLKFQWFPYQQDTEQEEVVQESCSHHFYHYSYPQP